MSPIPRTAMILAAGLGTRMRPLTERTPKSLLPLGGKPLIDHALDRLLAAGVELVVVNAHWQASRVEQHLPDATFATSIAIPTHEHERAAVQLARHQL